MSDRRQYEEVFADLARIVSAMLKVPAGVLKENSRLSDLALVESIKLLQIAGKIERHFKIELDNEALFRRGSLGEIAAEIVKLVELRQSEAV